MHAQFPPRMAEPCCDGLATYPNWYSALHLYTLGTVQLKATPTCFSPGMQGPSMLCAARSSMTHSRTPVTRVSSAASFWKWQHAAGLAVPAARAADKVRGELDSDPWALAGIRSSLQAGARYPLTNHALTLLSACLIVLAWCSAETSCCGYLGGADGEKIPDTWWVEK